MYAAERVDKEESVRRMGSVDAMYVGEKDEEGDDGDGSRFRCKST